MSLIQEFAPALFLLVAAIVVFGGGRIARQFGRLEALGYAVALCVIAIAIAFSPDSWRAAWAGVSGDDRLLSYARTVGLTGLLFLAGTRFDFAELKRDRLLLRNISWRIAALAFAACSFLVVYLFDVLSTSSRSSWTLFAYVIMTAYEAVKLFVLFGFAYFICSRFLWRAQGRVSTTRITIGFVLIAVLVFVLILITTNQLPALAWAFVAGALWRQSKVGMKFGDDGRPAATATLLSLAFVSMMLQAPWLGGQL